MTRTLIGPFNRVEGDLTLALDIEDGVVREARVTTTLFRGFETLLAGRPPLDALAIAPRICGICSLSQSLAASAALRNLAGAEPAPNGALAANIAHAAENIADHLTHFYLFFMPDFAREEYAARPWFEPVRRRFQAVQGEAQREVLPARKRLLETMGELAGKWPHTLAFQPGGSTRAIGLSERVRLLALVSEFEAFVETVLLGGPLDDLIAMSSLEEFQRIGGDFGVFLRLAEDLGLERDGRGPGPLMSFGAYRSADGALFPAGVFGEGAIDRSAIVEHVAASWMAGGPLPPAQGVTEPDADRADAYSWAKAPRYAGRAVEVGALARQALAGHPLALAVLKADGGASVRGRVVARVLEIALLTRQLGAWLRQFRLQDPFLIPLALPEEGEGVGMVEAARGALGHWLKVKRGEIETYQIVAPTTWNFSPRDADGTPGPVEQALEGVTLGPLGAKAARVQHIVRSFDPCMVCTAH